MKSLNKLNKKYKMGLAVLAIMLVIALTIGGSYALWMITANQKNANEIASGCFNVTFEEETGSDIKLLNTFPIPDEEGLATVPYKFKIKNICTIDANYTITLNSFGTMSNFMSETAIKYAIDDAKKLGSTFKSNNLEVAIENVDTSNIDVDDLKKSYILKDGFLRVGEEKEFALYLWMNETATIEEANKIFQAKVYITTTATKAPELANLMLAGSGYASDPFLNGPIKKEKIEKVTLLNSREVPETAVGFWDVSEQQNGQVMAWYTDIDSNGLFEVFIGQDDGVIANVNASRLFYNLNKVVYIEGLENLDISKSEQLYGFFQNCNSLKEIDLSSFNTSNVTNMNSLFSNCYALLTLDVTSFDTSNVTNMANMFTNSRTTDLDLSNFNTEKVVNMNRMFDNSNTLVNLNLSSFNTENVIDFSYMFSNCTKLTNLNINSFRTSNATNMSNLFSGCSNLTSLDLSKFNTSKVTNMANMFQNCSKLTYLDISSFNTSEVTDMTYMFYLCRELPQMSFSHFDTSNVTNMQGMFNGAKKQYKLDIRSWDTSKVENMYETFSLHTGIREPGAIYELDFRNFSHAGLMGNYGLFGGYDSMDILYASNSEMAEWFFNNGFYGTIIDCSSNSCP